MIRVFYCLDGTVFASANNHEATVDEVIAFLEQHRGKKFWNGAAGDTSFRVDDTLVSCDGLLTFTENYDDYYGEQISDFFLFSENKSRVGFQTRR